MKVELPKETKEQLDRLCAELARQRLKDIEALDKKLNLGKIYR